MEMNITENKYHECKAMQTASDISIQKIKGHWCWVFWNDKKGNQAHGIGFCPYCGERLEELKGTESE